MVTISNFERYVLPKILARGEDYYDSGAVLEMKKSLRGNGLQQFVERSTMR